MLRDRGEGTMQMHYHVRHAQDLVAGIEIDMNDPLPEENE